MPNENLRIWGRVAQVPKGSLKQITGGRMNGKSDINPTWRLQAATEVFGPVGDGWNYDIVDLFTVPGVEGELMCFAKVNVFYKKDNGEWSEGVPGIGGNMLVVKEKAGLRSNDEGYKMAITDALSVAFKALGFGAEVYAGRWDGTKYFNPVLAARPVSEEKKPEPETKIVGETENGEPVTEDGEILSPAENSSPEQEGEKINTPPDDLGDGMSESELDQIFGKKGTPPPPTSVKKNPPKQTGAKKNPPKKTEEKKPEPKPEEVKEPAKKTGKLTKDKFIALVREQRPKWDNEKAGRTVEDTLSSILGCKLSDWVLPWEDAVKQVNQMAGTTIEV